MDYLQRFLMYKRVNHVSNLTLGWLCDHAEGFRVDFQGKDSLLYKVKPLMELMLLLTTLADHGICNKKIEKLKRSAIAYAEEFDWHQLLSYDASGATPLATVATFFSSNHLRPPFEMEFARSLCSTGFLEGMDRVPFREMELAHCLGSLISPTFLKNLPVWFSNTTFGREQHLSRYTVDDLYSVTHSAFYLSNFGLRELTCALEKGKAERLRKELVALTAVVLRSDNIDVLGELLLCWLFCRVPDSAMNRMLFRQAIERLLCATTARGEVVPKIKFLRRAEDFQAGFTDLYHTTLVCTLLYAIVVKDRRYAC
jgi:hypothetical protein